MTDKQRVPILCYHRVHADDDPATPAVSPEQYCGHVTRSVFEKQIRDLLDRGFTIVTHRDLDAWLRDGRPLPGEKVAAIDFDDNRLNVFDTAFPVMRDFGVAGTVFVISDLADGRLPALRTYPAMGWDDLGRLCEAGWTLGAHTATHATIGKLACEPGGADHVEEELVRCNRAMNERLGVEPTAFAYPTGDFSGEAETIVKRHYRTARLWQEHFDHCYNTAATDPYRLVAVNVSMLVDDDDWRSLLDGVETQPR